MFMWHVGFVNLLLLFLCGCHLIFTSLPALVQSVAFEDFVHKLKEEKR